MEGRDPPGGYNVLFILVIVSFIFFIVVGSFGDDSASPRVFGDDIILLFLPPELGYSPILILTMAFLEWLIHASHLHAVINTASRDIYLILFLRFLRMYAYGGAALVLGVFLWISGNTGEQIGTFLTLVLLGDAGISYLLTVKADKIGRRRVLMIGSLLMMVAGITFALTTNYYILLIAAILGVISPGAHEIGPFRAVQESIVAQLTPVESRTGVYAWFAIASTLGMSIGLSVTGWITYFLKTYYEWEWKDPRIYSVVFSIYAVVGLIKAGVTLLLSEKCEPDGSSRREAEFGERETTTPLLNEGYRRTKRRGVTGTATGAVTNVWRAVTVSLSAESRSILIRICLLFALNSFAAAMLPVTVMSFYANVSQQNKQIFESKLIDLVAISMVCSLPSRIRDVSRLVGRDSGQHVLCVAGKTSRPRQSHGLDPPSERHIHCVHPISG